MAKQTTFDKDERFATYDEFIQHVTREIHSALLEDGAIGMRRSIHMWMGQGMMIAVENNNAK